MATTKASLRPRVQRLASGASLKDSAATNHSPSKDQNKEPPVNKKTVGFVCRGSLLGTEDSKKSAKKDDSTSCKKQPSTAPGMTVEQLVEEASKLPDSDRKRLLDQLALMSYNSRRKASRDLDLWATAVHGSLRRKCSGGGYGLLLVKQTLSQSGYWGPVQEFMESAGFAANSVQERGAVYSLLGDLVVDEMLRVCRHKALTPTLKMVANITVNVSAVWEDQFPGYIACGLAQMVVQQFRRRQQASA